MRLRTFTASDMPTAMQMVRDALGDNAIILATDAKAGSRQVTVTAAIDENDEFDLSPSYPSGKGRGDGNIPEPRTPNTAPLNNDIKFELQNILRFHNLPEIFVAKLLQKLTPADLAEITGKNQGIEELFRPALEKLLSRNFVFDPLRFSTQDLRLMLVGTPGIGKTMTIAKLATKLAMDKQPVAVITTDNNRAGGIEQLQAFTSILGIELQSANGRSELENILKTIPARTRVLIDTAGCSPYDTSEFSELRSIAGIKNIEPVMVLPAGGDSMETIDMLEIFAELPIRRLLITKADTTRRFGGVLAAAVAHGLSFCNISRSASITDSLHMLEPSLLAQMLLKYKL
jgi:flagellar biosynthesis protein FlhF